MASQARFKFDRNLKDVEKLLDMYEASEQLFRIDGKEIPEGYDIALKSSLVLLVTCWEAYIEDIVTEAIEHLSEHLDDPSKLPELHKEYLVKHLQSKGKKSYWELAGDGWKNVIADNLKKTKGQRDFNFKSPKSEETTAFIKNNLGIENISSIWRFNDKTAEENSQILDKLVEKRGMIAHRLTLDNPVSIEAIKSAIKFYKNLAKRTGGKIHEAMRETTGKGLWQENN